MATFTQAVSSQHFARYYITAAIAMVAIEELLAGQDTLDFDRLKRLGLLEQVQSKVPAKRDLSQRDTKAGLQCSIPQEYLAKLLEGEMRRGNTTFVKQTKKSTQKQDEKRSHRSDPMAKPREVLEKIRYNCSFGPEDKRQERELQVVHKGERRKKIRAGESIKVGCQFAFTITRYARAPNTLVVNFHHPDHMDKNGNPCHGKDFLVAEGSQKKRARAPWISTWVRNWAANKLLLEVPMEQILLELNEMYLREFTDQEAITTESHERLLQKAPRDFFLTRQDLRNIKASLSENTWKMAKDEAQSVQMHIEANPSQFFCYSQQNIVAGKPFIVGVQTDWQCQRMAELTKGGALCLDDTFGTNHLKYPLATFGVYDTYGNIVPVAWAVHDRETTDCYITILRALKEKMISRVPDWTPAAFVVDDSAALRAAIFAVFPNVKILLCTWHVKRCWLRNLITKVKCAEKRIYIMQDLGGLLALNPTNSKDPIKDVEAAVQEFCNKYKTEEAFVAYFRREWGPLVPNWNMAYRNFPHSGADTNAGLESFHKHGLKDVLAAGKVTMRGRRVDWLLWQLVEVVLRFYQIKELHKLAGFSRNIKQEKIVTNALIRAKDIEHKHVSTTDLGIYKVQGNSSIYAVTVLDTVFSCCSCPWGQQGNICKHLVKVLQVQYKLTEEDILRAYLGEETFAFRLPDAYDNVQLDVNEQLQPLFTDVVNSTEDVLRTFEDGQVASKDALCTLEDVQTTPEDVVCAPQVFQETNDENCPMDNDGQPSWEVNAHSFAHAEELCTMILAHLQRTPKLLGHGIAQLNAVEVRLKRLAAREQDLTAIITPLQRKKDDLGFTLKRRRPFFERGNGKCKKVCVESDTQTSSCPLVPNRSKGEGRLGPVERLQQQARVVLSKDKGTTDKR